MLCAVWLELHYGVHPLQPQIDCLFSIFCPMVDWRKRNRQLNSEKQLHEKWRQWMLVAVLFVWLNVSRRYWTQTNLKVKWQRIFTGESSQLWFSFIQMKCRFTALDWPRGRPHAGTCISSERWSRKKKTGRITVNQFGGDSCATQTIQPRGRPNFLHQNVLPNEPFAVEWSMKWSSLTVACANKIQFSEICISFFHLWWCECAVEWLKITVYYALLLTLRCTVFAVFCCFRRHWVQFMLWGTINRIRYVLIRLFYGERQWLVREFW